MSSSFAITGEEKRTVSPRRTVVGAVNTTGVFVPSPTTMCMLRAGSPK